MKYELPKKLKLNYKTWRCGGKFMQDECSHGLGSTCLLNTEGYMCCLGQFSLQANVPVEKIHKQAHPGVLKIDLPDLIDKNNCDYKYLSDLAHSAMLINDKIYTTIKEKAVALVKLFKEHGFELELVNFPKEIM